MQKLSQQVATLGFYSNSVQNSLQEELAQKLGRLSGYDDYSLFLCNSGAEANENAAKLASFQTGKAKVLAFNKAFHGRTSGAVMMTDNPKIQAPFNATANVEYVALNDIEAVKERLATGEFCAVIIEGIQGVSGIHTPTNEFLQELRAETKKHGVKLIVDEVQSGYGRTGRFFAHQWAGIKPDIITLAKGMGNGFPIGGIMIAPDFEAVKGMLGTTFGGNHLACVAAIAVLDVMERDSLVENAQTVGEYAIEELRKIESIKEVRGCGLMIGFDVEGSASELRKRLVFEKHIFTRGAGVSAVRLLPALNVTKENIDTSIKAYKELYKELK